MTLSRQVRSSSSAFRGAQRAAEDSLLLIASIFGNDVEVQRLLAAGKAAVQAEGGGPGGERAAGIRAALYDIVAPKWAGARELGARQLHFHLGLGSLSFLPVHRPECFGDRMDDLRFIVVDTNADGEARSGFETGRVYSGIRGVVPVWGTDEASGERVQIGSVEAGVSYERLVEGFKDATGSNVTILLTKGHVPLLRVLTVPVFREGAIVAVVGVGNKPSDYLQRDLELVDAVADMTCDFIERKRAEERVAYMAY